jgi:NarL family two-component system response regulator LiaR
MHTRFLIVDDSALVRHGLCAVLRANPQWEICGEAADGSTAVEMFRSLLPHIVILDFQMPGMNGLEAARQMLEIAPRVPIVMLTQHASTSLEEHAQRVGIRSVVPKTDVFSMVHMIEEFLARGGSEPNAEKAVNYGHRPIRES